MGGSLFLDPCRRFTQVNWKSELSLGIDSTGFNLGDRKYEKKNNSYIENYPTKYWSDVQVGQQLKRIF